VQDTSFPPRVQWPIRARLRAAGVLDSEAIADLAKPVRPDVETLRLAVETADDVLASAAAGGDFWVTVEVGRTTSLTIEEPPLRDLRDFLVVLRTFDMPSSDIQLVKLYRIIEGLGVLPDRQADLAEARAEFIRFQGPLAVPQVPDLDGGPPTGPTRLLTPRQAWVLWLDAEVIHRDYAKELRWRRYPPLFQGSIRMLAHDYGSMLLRQAKFIRDLIMTGLATPLP